MKTLLVIILLIAGVIAYMLFGGGKGEAETRDRGAQTPVPGQTATQTPETTAAQTAPTGQPAPPRTIGQDIESVVNYGTGYTQMKAKQSVAQKLDQISATQKQDIEKNLK